LKSVLSRVAINPPADATSVWRAGLGA